jgi:hypothetical protein
MNIHEIRNPAAQVPLLKKSTTPPDDSAFEHQLQRASAKSDVGRGTERPTALTEAEKEYFQQLFPNSAEDISTYNPYQVNGSRMAPRLGSLVDRKG